MKISTLGKVSTPNGVAFSIIYFQSVINFSIQILIVSQNFHFR